MLKKKKSKGLGGSKGRRRISSEKVKENLDKKGFKHPYITLPEGVEFFRAEFEKGKTSVTKLLNVIPFVAGKHNKEEEEGGTWWRAKYEAAKNVGPEEVGVASPSSIGKKCPIWDAFNKLSDDPDVDDDDIKDLRPKSREMYYVMDAEADDGKIYLLDISYFLFGKKLDEELRSEEGEDHMAFADAEEGCTLKLRFKQKTFGKASYQEVDRVEFIDRQGEEVTDEMIEGLKDPMSLITFKSYDEIKAMMDGAGAEASDDDEIPMDFPKKKKGNPKGKKKAGDEPDLDDMDRSALKAYIQKKKLDIKVVKSMDDDDIREAIKAEMDW